MSLILQIETATTVCSVALARDGEIVSVQEINERNIHAEKITLFIDEVIKSAGYHLNDIDAVAVSKGPGSYTGLRIGVSAAKGLCFALDKPLIAINTLDAMASGAGVFKELFNGDAILCPMIDARRMEVYSALYNTKAEGLKLTSAEIIDGSSFREIGAKQLVIFGDGAAKCRDVLTQNNVIYLADFSNSAMQLTNIAFKKFNAKEFEDVAYFEPFYLKEFVAGVKKVS